jgi:hypothetical protein
MTEERSMNTFQSGSPAPRCFRRASLLGTLGLLSMSFSAFAGSHTMSAEEANAQVRDTDARHTASLREEARQQYMTVNESRKASALIARNKEREDERVAAAAELAFQQKLQLAEASAAKITINNGGAGGNGFESLSSARASRSHASKYSFNSETVSHRPAISFLPTNRAALAALYHGQVAAEGVDAQMARMDAAALSAEEGGHAPYGTPVPGRPGFVTSPNHDQDGFIDVRGYNPGQSVMDPFTGKVMRVP